MELGISSYTYTWAIGVPGQMQLKRMDEIGLLDAALNQKVTVIQIADNLSLDTFDNKRLANLVHTAKQNHILLEAGARMMTEDNLCKYIKIAKLINSPILRFVIDGRGFTPGLDDIVSVIRNMLDELKSQQIILAIENHDRLKAKQFEYIIEKCASDYVGICLDTVNSIGANEDVFRVTEVLAPYTVNLHIKDYQISRHSHMMGFNIIGCPAGKGILPLEWVLEKLNQDRCKTAILEQWTPPEATIQETIKKESEWAKNSIAYLKTFFDGS